MSESSASYDPGQRLVEQAEQGSARATAQLTRGQTRIAHLLADFADGRLLFCREYGWLSWTGTHWAPDHGVGARNELIALLRNLLRDPNSDTVKDATQCMSNSAQLGVLAIAADLATFRINLDQLDADPYLLNLPNGTYDLHSLKLKPHDPTDHITKITRASYNPDAPAPVWTEHLEYFQPDVEIRDFLQRFFGYALLGKVVEHILLICYGPQGANGKGTTDRAIQFTLGDYATSADQNLLVATRANSPDSPSPARFALKGRRYVSMSETEKRAVIAEALMKNLTGGDRISARALHKDPVVFDPSHTMVLYTNHKPKLSADDSGVWRRVKLVPFDIKRPVDQWDKLIDEKLELEADAILTWMIDGYSAWLDKGLAPPKQVEVATSTYQYEEDILSQFLDTALLADPVAITPARDIWSEWETFAHENQAQPITQKDLYQRLEQAGYTRARRASGLIFKGVIINTTDPEPAPQVPDDEE